MKLIEALRCGKNSCVAFAGAGGKSSAMFQLAREFESPVIISASTHLAAEQVGKFKHHYIVQNLEQLISLLKEPVTGKVIFTGDFTTDHRTHGLNFPLLERILEVSRRDNLPFLIEADGSRKLPLKAPASHEPAIPPWVDKVVVSVGLDVIGQPIDENHVHRPKIINQLTGTNPGDMITAEIIARLMGDPDGGLKNIPQQADRILLLNQVNSEARLKDAIRVAEILVEKYSSILMAAIPHWDNHIENTMNLHPVIQRREKIAGIILAAGKAERYGSPKILLDWGGIPVVRKTTLNALEAGLSPVILVLGAYFQEVIPVVSDLPIVIIENRDWEKGQATSFQRGVSTVPDDRGGFVVLLADQPHIPIEIIKRLIHEHEVNPSPIIIPTMKGKRANPVFFDKVTRNEIAGITGDMGGRAIFNQFQVMELPFDDVGITEDIDTVEDYYRLYKRYVKEPHFDRD